MRIPGRRGGDKRPGMKSKHPRRRSRMPALRVLLLSPFVLLCVTPVRSIAGALAPAPTTRPFPINRFVWSRHAQQDKRGYYSEPLGLCDDFPEDSRTQARLDRDFAVIRDAGAKVFRVGISWQDTEEQPGRYDWSFWDKLVDAAQTNHVELIPYVCYTPWWAASSRDHFWTQPPSDDSLFADFMRTIAARYRNRVHSWELWNEPDNPDFWQGSAEQYAGLVKAGAEAVRQADPSAVVVLGGMSGNPNFLQTLISRYGLGDYVDVINFHAYFETWNYYRLEHIPDYIEHMQDAAGGADCPQDLWLAEFGYSNLPGASGAGISDFPYQHTPAFQAVALLRSQFLALSTGKLSLSAWYRINDLMPTTGVIGDKNNRYLGVVDVEGNKKPAFFALRFYNQLFDQPARCIDNLVTIHTKANSDAVAHVFELADYTLVAAAWLRSALPGDLPPGAAADTRREEISISLPRGTSGHMAVYDATGRVVQSPARYSDGMIRNMTLTGPSIFIARIGK